MPSILPPGITPYYERNGIAIVHGDCRDILPLLVSASCDLVLTDPPYEAEAHTKGRRIHDQRTNVIRSAPLTFTPIDADLRAFAGCHMARLSRRWTLVFCQIEAAMLWRDALEAGGARYMRTMVWAKPNGQPQLTGDRPGMGYESIVTAHALAASRWNGGGRLGWFLYPTDANFSRTPRWHETQKPITLMRDLVTLFSDPGDLILDPFMGSGTTLRAAADLGRRAIGIEISEAYCAVAAQRLQQESMPLDFKQERERIVQPEMFESMAEDI